ncbi:ATP-binding cassette domain-containing protein [Peribacillus frigoritolerans]|nr:ATP-binding cassette domain-containing protein [Peribacillus frigoritolerans]
MLKLTDVAVNYGSFTAINHVNIEVAEGEIVVLLGANGAGKSTTFPFHKRNSKLSKGEIHFQGMPIGGRAPDKNVRGGDRSVCRRT